MADFIRYDKENPQIWNMFVELSRKAKAKGFKHYSAKGIFELMRWHTGTGGKGKYKICNNYTPDYARKMMKLFPEFKGFFRVKSLLKAREISN